MKQQCIDCGEVWDDSHACERVTDEQWINRTFEWVAWERGLDPIGASDLRRNFLSFLKGRVVILGRAHPGEIWEEFKTTGVYKQYFAKPHMDLIPIYEVCEGSAELGGQMGWYTKGHVDKGQFLMAALELEIFEGDECVPAVCVDDVKHTKWRVVPISGSTSGGRFVEGDGRGAFEVTAIHWPGGGWGTHICMLINCNEVAKNVMVPASLPFGNIYLRLCPAHMIDYEANKAQRRMEALEALRAADDHSDRDPVSTPDADTSDG